MAGPLQGLRVLDLTRVLAGPFCSLLLGDLGAEIIKIEHPQRGDDARAFGPFIQGESAYFMSLNRGKLGVTLDLKSAQGRDIFMDLVAKADIVLENFRPGTMASWGIGYQQLCEHHPGLIYAACSGFGQTGPYAMKPAYDVIVQAMGGLMSITGPEGGPPTRVGASLGDITAALFTTVGILTALHERSSSGLGQLVDVAMLDSQVAILENALARYYATGQVPVPLGNRHPSITPFSAFATADGQLVVAIGNDGQWSRFCSEAGSPELINDPRFATNAARTTHWQELEPIMNQLLAQHSTAYWQGRLEAVGIPCGPVQNVEQLVADPQVRARNMLVELDHPRAGSLPMAGLPIKLSRTPGEIEQPAPLLGQHNAQVLGGLLGLSEPMLEQLKQHGII